MNKAKKLFLLVGFEGLAELLTQYNRDELSAFIFQDKPGNRFFVEKFLMLVIFCDYKSHLI